MTKESLSCLVIGEKSEFIKLRDLLKEGFGTKLSLINSLPINVASIDFNEFNFDFCVCIFDEKTNIYSDFLNFITFAKKSFPVAVILKEKNYKIAFEILNQAKTACFFEDEFNKDELLTKLKKDLNKNSKKKNESKLNTETNHEFSSAVENIFLSSRLGAAIFDADGNMLFANPSLEKLFGMNSVELKQFGLAEICKPDYNTYNEDYNSFIKGHTTSFDQKKSFSNKEGIFFWCKVSASIIKDYKNLTKLILVTFNNISVEIKLKEELEKERYFLQALLDNIPDAIYFKDINHRFTKVSKFVHLHGLKNPEDAIGKTDFDFFAGEHAQSAYNDEEEIMKSGIPIINKIEKETFPNGDIAWVSTTKVPLINKFNEVSGIVGISRDITDAKIKELALQRSEERYRNLVEYSPDLIAVVYNNRVIYVNSTAMEMLKVPGKDSVINKNIMDFAHPRFAKLVKEYLEETYKNKKPFKISNFKALKATGESFDVEVTGIPTSYNGKNAVQLIIRDITEFKKQEKLKQTTMEILHASNSTRNLDELFKYIHRIIGRWMSVKNFYIALHDEVTNMISFPYFIDEEDDFAPPQKFGNGLTEYIIRTGEAKLLTENQLKELYNSKEVSLVGAFSKVWLGVPLQIKEKTIGVLVVQDYKNENVYTEHDKEILELISFTVSRVIERKQAEDERLNYIDQLKDINATKDRFFSFVSHDLRSPFSSLLGFTDLVLEDFGNLSREELKCYLEIINSSAKNLYNLLNNLLEFSRFQTGRIKYTPHETDLAKLVQKNMALIEGNAIKKEIILINAIHQELFVFVDEEMISSVLQNLLSNAIKFTQRNGIIKVEATLTEVSGEVMVSVEDNGIGMEYDVVENLFKIDVIHSTSGTEKESGTGLGLILTKEFVETNKGKIWVESTPGKGTTFRFTLPLAE